MYPLKFKPIFKHRIWGGQKLKDVFGKDLPANQKIGESWELADLPNNKNLIANGEFAGETIIKLIEKYPENIDAMEELAEMFEEVDDLDNAIAADDFYEADFTVEPDPGTSADQVNEKLKEKEQPKQSEQTTEKQGDLL